MDIETIAKSFRIDDTEQLKQVVAEAADNFQQLEYEKAGHQEAREAAPYAREILERIERGHGSWAGMDAKTRNLFEWWLDRYFAGKIENGLIWSVDEDVPNSPPRFGEKIEDYKEFFERFLDIHSYRGRIPNYPERVALHIFENYWKNILGRTSESTHFVEFARRCVMVFGDPRRIAGTWEKMKRERREERDWGIGPNYL